MIDHDDDDFLQYLEESLYGLADIGVCLKCRTEHYGIEPDARKYECSYCGEYQVYGAQEILFMTNG